MKPSVDALISFEMQTSSITRDVKLDFSLNICEQCNHYFNSGFDPEIIDYSKVEIETFFNHYEFNQSIKEGSKAGPTLQLTIILSKRAPKTLAF